MSANYGCKDEWSSIGQQLPGLVHRCVHAAVLSCTHARDLAVSVSALPAPGQL